MLARIALMTLVSLPALAADRAASVRNDTRPPDINVVDDVGVGDHFPSQVPGTGPYRLPERDVAPPPQRSEAAPRVVVVAPPSEVTPRSEPLPEQTASDPNEWAALPAAKAPPPAEAPAKPEAAPAPTPAATAVSAPTPEVPKTAPAPAPAAAPAIPLEVERDMLSRASDSLLQGTCARQMPGLTELLERSDNADTKARARILRARCFTQRAKAENAKAEYLVYLHDFPSGAWVGEAREAVGQ